MTGENVSASQMLKAAASLGLHGPLPGSAKRRFALPDIEIEDAPLGDKMHCMLHLVWRGSVVRTQYYTPGPELDALILKAQGMGFRVITRPAGFRRPRY